MNTPLPAGHRPTPARLVLEAAPLALMLVAAIYWLATREPPAEPQRLPVPVAAAPELEPLAALSAAQLGETFASHNYGWPPSATIPRVAVARLPPDLADQPAARRKVLFMQTLLPLILAENNAIRREKRVLARWREAGEERGRELAGAFDRLRQRYRVDGELSAAQARDVLKSRVGVVPPSLALAQAAIETGWGTSRFALEGNNLFGEWTWDASQGLAPRRRDAGKSHYVRRFPGLRASVRGYLHNLNTHAAYAPLRARREASRAQGQAPDGNALAAGLAAYSERGQAYVDDVRTIIRQNRLERVAESVRLRGSER